MKNGALPVERRATELEIAAPRTRTRVAIDGEPVILDSPLRLSIEPQALRLLLPSP